MAAVPVEIRGTLYDLASKSSRQVFIQGSAVRSDVGVGGGPIIPPSGNGDHIWGPTDPRPTPPIYIPPAVPPSMKPPEAPEPGSPTTAVPGDWPVQPITPPEYLIVQYPGVGPVVVAPPAEAQPK